MNTEQRFEVVKCESKGDNPPEYMRDLTLQEVYNYFFNWHPHLETAPLTTVEAWYKGARGWCWQTL